MDGCSHESRYCLFSPSSVQIFAETIGLTNLQQGAAALLSEDATYRIREIAHVGRPLAVWCSIFSNRCDVYRIGLTLNFKFQKESVKTEKIGSS